jgi:hypothetical protein
MLQTILSRHTIHSLIAMLLSWLLSSAISLLIEGTWEINVLITYAQMVFGFVGIGWMFGVLPFMHLYNRFLKQNRNRFLFPFLSVFGSLLIFSILISIFMGIGVMYSIVRSVNIFLVTSGLVGGFWGLFYVSIYMYYTRTLYTR